MEATSETASKAAGEARPERCRAYTAAGSACKRAAKERRLCAQHAKAYPEAWVAEWPEVTDAERLAAVDAAIEKQWPGAVPTLSPGERPADPNPGAGLCVGCDRRKGEDGRCAPCDALSASYRAKGVRTPIASHDPQQVAAPTLPESNMTPSRVVGNMPSANLDANEAKTPAVAGDFVPETAGVRMVTPRSVQGDTGPVGRGSSNLDSCPEFEPLSVASPGRTPPVGACDGCAGSGVLDTCAGTFAPCPCAAGAALARVECNACGVERAAADAGCDHVCGDCLAGEHCDACGIDGPAKPSSVSRSAAESDTAAEMLAGGTCQACKGSGWTREGWTARDPAASVYAGDCPACRGTGDEPEPDDDAAPVEPAPACVVDGEPLCPRGACVERGRCVGAGDAAVRAADVEALGEALAAARGALEESARLAGALGSSAVEVWSGYLLRGVEKLEAIAQGRAS